LIGVIGFSSVKSVPSGNGVCRREWIEEELDEELDEVFELFELVYDSSSLIALS
jgi:hypothetical protein